MVEVCIHLANLFYLASFLGRDMLWLRALTCCGLVLGIVFFTCQTTPLYGPTVWHVLFLGINGFQIVRLGRGGRALTLPAEQERIATEAFGDLSRDELLNLLTRLMSGRGGLGADLHRASAVPLTAEERAVRDIALSRLSRGELLNLLTRRLWVTLCRFHPAALRRRPAPPNAAAPANA